MKKKKKIHIHKFDLYNSVQMRDSRTGGLIMLRSLLFACECGKVKRSQKFVPQEVHDLLDETVQGKHRIMTKSQFEAMMDSVKESFEKVGNEKSQLEPLSDKVL